MSLDNSQKNYIKRNLRDLSISQIASDLGLPESEVLEYLKKKWSPEKYKKFLRKIRTDNSDSEQANENFSFFNFFRENRLALLFLAALVFVSYFNSFSNGFTSDDVAGFAKNESIGKFSAVFGGLLHFSLPRFFQFIAFHIGGLHPFTFRIINILSHLGCVVIIFSFLSLSLNKRIALIAASFFAVHPILIESVSWISGGLYSIYSFFFLLSFLFYLFSENGKHYLYYSVLFYVFGILSSEKTLVLFLVFVLYEFTFGSLRHNWKKILPFFLISLAPLLIYIAKIGSRQSDVSSMSYQQGGGGLYNPLVQIPVAIGSYMKLIFWPAKLTLYQTEMAFSQMQFFFFTAITLLFFGTIAWSYFKNKNIFFWLVFFIITLLPTLTPFKISWVVAERYAYLGTLGVIVVAAILFDKLMKINENAKMVGYFALIFIVASLSVRTIIRNKDWKSEDTLWISTAQVAPSGQQIHNNLGDVYARQGDLPKAIEEFSKAIEINPNYADAYHNRGNTFQQIGKLDQAIADFQKAVSINPNLWQSYQNLAAIAFNQGDYQGSIEYIKKALAIDPQNPKLQENLKAIEAKIQGE